MILKLNKVVDSETSGISIKVSQHIASTSSSDIVDKIDRLLLFKYAPVKLEPLKSLSFYEILSKDNTQ